MSLYIEETTPFSLKKLKDNAVYLLKHSAIEVAIFGALGLGLTAPRLHEAETIRSQTIELSFSEIEQTMKDAQKDGRTLSPTNEYLLKTNDAFMKIFEAHNHGYIYGGDPIQSFAHELDFHINLKRYPYDLRQLIQEVPELSKEVLNEHKLYVRAHGLSEKLSSVSGDIWDEHHSDNYHTEYYTETEYYYETEYYTDYDSEGNSISNSRQVQHSREVDKSREVYDDTDHYYYYNKSQGELSDLLAINFFKQIPDLDVGKIYTASKTNAFGEYAAEKSREDNEKNKFDSEDYLNFSRSWYDGSTLLLTAKAIEHDMRSLKKSSVDWNKKKNTARDTIYNTSSRSDSGPIEYRSANRLHSDSYSLERNLNEFITSIEKTRDEVAQLEGMIDTYIHDAFTYPNSLSLSKRLSLLKNDKNAIVDKTKELYTSTFKEGVDLKSYRYGYVIGFSLLGMAVGAAIGLGIDALGNKTDVYDSLGSSRKKQSKGFLNDHSSFSRLINERRSRSSRHKNKYSRRS